MISNFIEAWEDTFTDKDGKVISFYKAKFFDPINYVSKTFTLSGEAYKKYDLGNPSVAKTLKNKKCTAKLSLFQKGYNNVLKVIDLAIE